MLSLGLRGGGLAGKFILIFFLARVITAEDLGVYGLIVVTLSYVSFFLGLDFYIFSGRAMAQAKSYQISAMLRDQLVLYSCSYLVMLPLLSILFLIDLLPIEFIVVFYVLLILEHLSQECVRLLIMLEHPFKASVMLFIRIGSWAYVLIGLFVIDIISIDLITVFWSWVAADSVALILGGWWFRKLLFCKQKSNINWPWIFNGLRISAFFLLGTLALRGLFTFDRYLVDFFSGKEILGVYSFYIGVSSSLITFIDAAIFSFRYPKLIRIYKMGDITVFNQYRMSFIKETIVSVIVLGLILGVGVVPILKWIDRPVYLEYISIYYILLGSSMVYVISYVPHLVLYAMGEDKIIVGSHIAGLVLFLLFGFLLGFLYGFAGVTFSILLSFIFIGLFKQYYVSKLVILAGYNKVI